MYSFPKIEKALSQVLSLETQPSLMKQTSPMNLAENSEKKSFFAPGPALSQVLSLETQPSLMKQTSPMNLAENSKKKSFFGVLELDWLQAALGLDPGPVELPPSPDVPPKDPSPTAVHSTSELQLNDPKLCVFHSLTRLSATRFWHNTTRAMRRALSLPALHLQYRKSKGSISDISDISPSPVAYLQEPVGNPLPPTAAEYAYEWMEMPKNLHNASETIIGSGCFSSVLHLKSNELDLVIKVFKKGIVSDFHIIHEADTAAYMSSLGIGPNITGLVYPCDLHPQPALAMPYLEGSSDLYNLLQRKGLTKFDVFDLLRQAARLIVVIHSQGFLHNDIKPSNMLAACNPTYHGKSHIGMAPPWGVTGSLKKESRFRLYLIDFGHTTYLDGACFRFDHMSQEEIAKIAHLAPEVIEGAETTIYSDVYSFGKLLDVSVNLLQKEDITEMLTPLIKSCTFVVPEERPNMELVERQLSAMVPHPSSKSRTSANERQSRWDKAHASSGTLWGKPSVTHSLSDISDSEEEEVLHTYDFVQNPIRKPDSLSEKNLASVLGLQNNFTSRRYSGSLIREFSTEESRTKCAISRPWYSDVLNKEEIAWLERDSPLISGKQAVTSRDIQPSSNNEEVNGLDAFCKKIGNNNIDFKSPREYGFIRGDLFEANEDKMHFKVADEIDGDVETYSDDSFESDDENDSNDNF